MKINYRPEIDGLRAIAVSAVIFYHAQLDIFDQKVFEGGFVGVDIFFVISGYLITSLILKELITTGKFSFRYFYERRARRILPALIVVILASLPAAWLFLVPGNFIEFTKSILYSLGFSSNFYFIIPVFNMEQKMVYLNHYFTHGHFLLRNNIIFCFLLSYFLYLNFSENIF